jgi:hypothetical protein
MAEFDQHSIESLCLFLQMTTVEDETEMSTREIRELDEIDEIAKMVLEVSDAPPISMTTT